MHVGNLYKLEDEQFVAGINYQLMGETPTNLWGELVPIECAQIGVLGDYMLELDNNRRIRCHLRKKVNRAVVGIPTRYIYHFMGMPLPG